jgi:hypothetical protein
VLVKEILLVYDSTWVTMYGFLSTLELTCKFSKQFELSTSSLIPIKMNLLWANAWALTYLLHLQSVSM